MSTEVHSEINPRKGRDRACAITRKGRDRACAITRKERDRACAITRGSTSVHNKDMEEEMGFNQQDHN